MEGFEIRDATLEDVSSLRTLECRAAALFAQVPELAHFADDGPSMSIERQIELIARKLIWMIGDCSSLTEGLSAPCAFLAADVVDQSLHIFELSVSPDFQRRGFAAALIHKAIAWARQAGLKSVSLTTDREVPWNGPMYRKRGFREINAVELGPEHVDIVRKEVEDGLDSSRRCTMVFDAIKE